MFPLELFQKSILLIQHFYGWCLRRRHLFPSMTTKLSIFLFFVRNCNYVPILTYLTLVLLATSVLVHVKSTRRSLSHASQRSSIMNDNNAIRVSAGDMASSYFVFARFSATFHVYPCVATAWISPFRERFVRCVVRGSIQWSSKTMLFDWLNQRWIVQRCLFSVEVMDSTTTCRSR